MKDFGKTLWDTTRGLNIQYARIPEAIEPGWFKIGNIEWECPIMERLMMDSLQTNVYAFGVCRNGEFLYAIGTEYGVCDYYVRRSKEYIPILEGPPDIIGIWWGPLQHKGTRIVTEGWNINYDGIYIRLTSARWRFIGYKSWIGEK